MNFLIDPNVAYFLLVLGAIFGFLALFSPGTGIIEVMALFSLLLAGYGIVNLPTNLWALLVLLFGLVPFILAVRFTKNRTNSLIFRALAAAALVVGSVFLFRGQRELTAVNPVLAVVVSLTAIVLMFVIVQKGLEAIERPLAHDPGQLIGKLGEARTNIFREGTLYVNGELWTARSSHEIPAGSHARVISRDGLVLVVQKED